MTDIPHLSRPAFFDSQPLTGADLTAVTDYHAAMLALHQRTLHSWGIASGLSVAGAKTARTVEVGAGYALDKDGHSIVLSEPRVLQVPSVFAGPTGGAVTYYITISYLDDDQLDARIRSGVCGANGAVRRVDEPRLRWQDPSE